MTQNFAEESTKVQLSNTTKYFRLGKLLGVTVAIWSTVVCGSRVHADCIINNGNFATGDFTGWTVAETGPYGLGTTVTDPNTQISRFYQDYGVTSGSANGVGPVPAPGDTYGAFFNASGGVMDLTQNVLVPTGGTFSISAQAWPIFPDDDIVTINLDGVLLATFDYTTPQPYSLISAIVSTAAGWHTVDFQFSFNGDNDGESATFFDDASMDAVAAVVPEPTTVFAGMLLLIPFGASSLQLWRKSANARHANAGTAAGGV
jgi:hypothetical protein